MTAEGLERLILWYENKARFFKGMKGVDSVRKNNQARLDAQRSCGTSALRERAPPLTKLRPPCSNSTLRTSLRSPLVAHA